MALDELKAARRAANKARREAEKAERERMGKPEPGKQYHLTGPAPSIVAGNTWAESEVRA